MKSFKEDNYTIYLPGRYSDDIKTFVKEEILKFKKKTTRYISGYYIVTVYINEVYGIIIDLKKEDDFDFFKDFVELDIKVSDNNLMYFCFDDYFSLINKSNIYYLDNSYYVNLDSLNKKEVLKLTEFSKIIYGKIALSLKEKLKKVKYVV